MDNDENIYRINLENALTAMNLIYDLSSYLEKEEAKNKKIFLKMSDIDLSVAQLKSIRSLINSINSSLSFISTNSEMTKESAMALEIVISNEDTNLSAKLEPEKTYKTIEEVIEEKNETSENNIKEEEKPPVISIETDKFTHEDAQNALESIFEEPSLNNEENTTNSEEETVSNETEEEQKEEAPQEEHSEEAQSETQNQNEEEQKKEDDGSINPLDSIFETEKKLEDILNIQEPAEDIAAMDAEYYKNLDNEFTQEDLEIENLPTMYIKHTLRSGQVVNYEGNVVIIGDCHTGSEIHATGDITVWGILSGIAHAGNAGNARAKIRALKMNAIQLRISDSYARKPDVLNTVLMEKTNVFTPEEARYIDGDIIIFKIND